MLTLHVLEDEGALEDLCPAWEHLERHCPEIGPFQTAAWQRAWRATLGRRTKPSVLVGRQGGEVVGVFPLAKTWTPFPTWRSAGAGPSDYLGPVALPASSAEFFALSQEWLQDRARSHVIDLHQVRVTGAHFEYDAQTNLTQGASLLLALPDRWETYFAGLSKSLRYDLRGMVRKPEELRITLETGERGLEILTALHRERWRARWLPGAFTPAILRFHQVWLRNTGPTHAEFPVLWRKNEPVGALYLMRIGDRVCFYQAGFHPAAKSISPGSVLVGDAIRRAIQDGSSTFDFLRGDEPYKRRWKPNATIRHSRLVSFPRTLSGAAARVATMGIHGVEQQVRRRVEGRGLR
jgi:CelD/BcsL family acetyltransferase involved in cellulose biosynthesis